MSRRKHSKTGRSSKRKNRGNQGVQKLNKEALARLLDWLLPSNAIFSKMKLHGNTKWLPKCLVCLALLWAWSESRCLTDAYVEAIGCCRSIFGGCIVATYQGFMRALTRWTPVLMDILWLVLHERMEEIGGQFWRIYGWFPVAFDGSRSSAPRTKANEKAFCAANYGRGKTAKYRKKKSKGMRRKKNERNKPQPQEPQAWITMMWHMGLRLPWMWRLGPSNSSERAHVTAMVDDGKFPKNTLFCGDAGFVGYALWLAILESGADFLVRVGGNVSLLRESSHYQQIKNGLVLCWPQTMQSKRPPLQLRLVKVRIGKTDVYMLTSVLNPTKLTNKQIIKLYKMRWGVEVEFRGLKQTLDRAKLRCRNDQRLLAELNWSIMAMAVAELFALKEQLAQRSHTAARDRQASEPAKRSLAKTMRAIRHCVRHPNSEPEAGNDLTVSLRNAVTDGYRRKSKAARYQPPHPDKKPLGEPKVYRFTAQHRKKLRKLAEKSAA